MHAMAVQSAITIMTDVGSTSFPLWGTKIAAGWGMNRLYVSLAMVRRHELRCNRTL